MPENGEHGGTTAHADLRISGEFCRKMNPVIIRNQSPLQGWIKAPHPGLRQVFSDHLSHKLHSEYTLIAHINCYYGDKEEGGGIK